MCDATGDIGLFRIISESAVSSGVRRIEALTGEAARQWLVGREEALKSVAATLKTAPDEVEARVAALVDERKRSSANWPRRRKQLALGGGGGAAADGRRGNRRGEILRPGARGHGPQGTARPARRGEGSAWARASRRSVAVNDGKAAFAVGVTDDLTDRFSAVDLVRAGVAALGGKGGGGRPDMAQGGGPDGDKAEDALAAVREALAANRRLRTSVDAILCRRGDGRPRCHGAHPSCCGLRDHVHHRRRHSSA